MIDFANVTAVYKNGFVGLNNVTFKVAAGEFVYIIGETGSGKSTIIKILHGELYPQKGKVRVGKFVVNEIKPNKMAYYKRAVGVVFQDFKLLPMKKVFENISFVAECVNMPLVETRLRMKTVLDLVGLWDKRNSFPHELSGGQQQGVVIARAMMNKPRLILADEPTGNLDPSSSEKILQLLKQVNRQEKTTILMATHNLELIKKEPARVLVIEKGHLVNDIPKEEVSRLFGRTA